MWSHYKCIFQLFLNRLAIKRVMKRTRRNAIIINMASKLFVKFFSHYFHFYSHFISSGLIFWGNVCQKIQPILKIIAFIYVSTLLPSELKFIIFFLPSLILNTFNDDDDSDGRDVRWKMCTVILFLASMMWK